MYTDVIAEVVDHAQKRKDAIIDILFDAECLEDITIVANEQINQLSLMSEAIKIARIKTFVHDCKIR